MRKTLFVSILLATLLVMQIFTEEYPLVKLAEYEQNEKNGLYLVDEREFYPKTAWAAEKDWGNDIPFSAESLTIDDEGKIYIYQTNYSRMMYLGKDYQIERSVNFNLVNDPFRISSYKGFFDFDNYFGYYNRFDINGKLIVSLIVRDYAPISGEKQVYYDEQCDVLFFIDEKSNLYSIEHPSMDEAENKANFKGPTETIEMLNSGKYAPHLTAKNNVLWVDGLGYYWPGKVVNGIAYQYVSESKVSIFVPNNTLRFDFRSPDEQIESITIHPCGDIYVLRMNWNTNTHILYRVENTWDAQWRASWYAEHPDAPGQELPSGNGVQAAATAVRTGYLNDDRIRLRKGPGTGTESLGTYPVNTTFTIIENSGVKQTIDGVTDEWIKVRLSDGTEGYFYGQYVSEK